MNKPTSLFIGAVLIAFMIGGCGGDSGNGPPDTGAIRVTTSTMGEGPDPDGYTCRIDGGQHSHAMGINETHTFNDIATGEHSVELTGIDGNCEASGDNPRTLSILIPGQTASTTFNVNCALPTGGLMVATVTSGDTLDTDGYTVTVDGGQSQPVDVTDAVTFTNLQAGNHSIELSGVAKNCAVTGTNPRTVNVTADVITQETYRVTCAAALFDRITFNSDRTGNHDIYVMRPNGSDVIQLTNHDMNEEAPRVSPDGTKILFMSDRDGNDEIYVMNADGTDPLNLTNSASADHRAMWSPDGSKIAFASDRDGDFEIYVMNADGSAPVQLTQNDATDWNPSWSPAGSEIAFGSDRGGWFQIYAMNSSDGANVRQLHDTQDRDGLPVWSPDGNEIVFHSNRDGNFDVYVIDADGSNERRLTDDPAFDGVPNWSPDGTKIVFVSGRDGSTDVYVMNADGSGQTRLTFEDGSDTMPRWTPTR